MIGIDLSLRSTAIVALDKNNNLIDFQIIQPSTEKFIQHYNDEEMLIYISDEILKFIHTNNEIDGIVIEGLSFASCSSSKDFLWGNFWVVRSRIRMHYPNLLIGIIPVMSWRSPLLTNLTKQERKELKGDKMKNYCVQLLPKSVYSKFIAYIENEKLDKKGIYDLTDAYFLTIFRNTL